jgi:hypothetical protein
MPGSTDSRHPIKLFTKSIYYTTWINTLLFFNDDEKEVHDWSIIKFARI